MWIHKIPSSRLVLRFSICIVLSVLILAPLILPFTKSGKAWTYDLDVHAFRMAAFHQAVTEGNIPPKWSTQLVYGWGSPVFLFNWTLPYWMGEPFLFAGWSVVDAQKAVIIISVIFSYVAMGAFLWYWLGFWPALGGAVVYEWALFRIYLLFTGGSLGMLTVFMFWPLLFLGVLKLKHHRTVSFLFISLGMAFTMLSHQVMFLMIQPLFVLFSLMVLRKDKIVNKFPFLLVSYLTGLGLTAYFWLPAFVERNFLHMDITQTLVSKNFLDWITIFHEPGITFRNVPPLQYWYWSTGWNLYAIASIAILFLLKIVLDSKLRLKYHSMIQLMGLFTGFFFIGQYLMTPVSRVFWSYVPLLSMFQYPVRFQALSLFSASVVVSYIIYHFRKRAWIIALVIIVGTIFLNAMAIPNDRPRDMVTDEYYKESNSTADMMGEYLPSRASVEHFFDTSNRFERHPVARIIDGTGNIDTMTKRSSDVSFTVQADSPLSVVINQFYFPGWRIEANSVSIPYESYGYGEMLARMPKGSYKVRAEFTHTPIRTLGKIITVLTILVMFYFVYNIRRIKM